MSEKSDKLRAMLEKEKERRIKLNNRIYVVKIQYLYSIEGFCRNVYSF